MLSESLKVKYSDLGDFLKNKYYRVIFSCVTSSMHTTTKKGNKIGIFWGFVEVLEQLFWKPLWAASARIQKDRYLWKKWIGAT